MARQAQLEQTAETPDPGRPRESRRPEVPARRGSMRAVSVRQRLMLIEDDFMLRASMSELLTAEGYLVSCAADGAEALDRLDREPTPDVIVLDIMMPKMDGVSFRQAQLRSPALRDVPTIAVTATRSMFNLEPLGFEAVLQKPLDFDRLVEALAKLRPTS